MKLQPTIGKRRMNLVNFSTKGAPPKGGPSAGTCIRHIGHGPKAKGIDIFPSKPRFPRKLASAPAFLVMGRVLKSEVNATGSESRSSRWCYRWRCSGVSDDLPGRIG